MKILIAILLLLLISSNITNAKPINYYILKCTGILNTINSSSLANWNLVFKDADNADLEFLFNKKKRIANVKVSIQKNSDFHANGKWKNIHTNGNEFFTLKFVNETNNMNIKHRRGTIRFEAKGKCTKSIISK